VDDDVLHMRLAVADIVFQAAGQLVRVVQGHVDRHDRRYEHDESTGGVQQPQLARWLPGALFEPRVVVADIIFRVGAVDGPPSHSLTALDASRPRFSTGQQSESAQSSPLKLARPQAGPQPNDHEDAAEIQKPWPGR
jgi:hypothetical protein